MNGKITNVSEIAKAFLLLSQPEIGDGITNLKLQKLLYYAQGFYLAINNGKPLFDEPIVAWAHGPVVASVYHNYKKFGSQIIDRPDKKADLSKETLNYIKRIWNLFGQFSAWKLRDMTHQESPWKDTKQSEVITHDKMIDFFSTKITKE